MALVHRAKMTHYFSPSEKHLNGFFRKLTRLYGEQSHTDLTIVAGGGNAASDDGEEDAASAGGAVFCSHQVSLMVIIGVGQAPRWLPCVCVMQLKTRCYYRRRGRACARSF